MSSVAGEWTQVARGRQELTADVPRLSASLLHRAPTPLSADRWCESSAGQSRTICLLRRHRSAIEDGKRAATTLATKSARASGHRALCHSRSPQSAGVAARPREVTRGEVSSRATFGTGAKRPAWAPSAVGTREPRRQQQERERGGEEEESPAFRRRSSGDASVNARAMSRRKQGNPQHLSQREITRKYAQQHRIKQTAQCLSPSTAGA